ncbi:hypothetical protein ACHAXN_002285 [Cyclotella atomus]
MKFLALFIICSDVYANANETTPKRHKQRLPVNMNEILASSGEGRESISHIAAINSDSPTSSSIFPTSVTTKSPSKSPSSNTNSPAKEPGNTGGTASPVTEATDFPTGDIFSTRKPTSKPTVAPTITSRPSVEDDGLPTATIAPATSSPIEPPSAPFPTFKPTEGTETPTGREGVTYSPTEEVVLPTPSPSVSWGPSSIPSATISDAPSETPSLVPSSSSHPTEVYRPSSSPTISSHPSSEPSSLPSLVPSSLPSLQPSEYKGEPTNSVGGQDVFVSAIACPSSNSSASKIFDGTTDEFICHPDNSTTRRLVQSGFWISPNLTNPSIVEKLRIYAGHDCIQCDAVEYSLLGSLASSVSENGWNIISSGVLPWINDEPARNDKGAAIKNSSYEHGDESLSFTEITFNNTKAYIHYSLIFRSRDDAYDLVVAEVELPGREFEVIRTNSPTTKPTKRRTRRPNQAISEKPTRKPRAPRTKKPQQPTKTPRPHKRTRKPSSKPTLRPLGSSKSAKSVPYWQTSSKARRQL